MMKNDRISTAMLGLAVVCTAVAQLFPAYLAYAVVAAIVLCLLMFVNYLWRNRSTPPQVEASNAEVEGVTESSFIDWREVFTVHEQEISLGDEELPFEPAVIARRKATKLAMSEKIVWVPALRYGHNRRELKGAHAKRGRSQSQSENTDFCY